MPCLLVDNVSKSFQGEPVLERVSLSIECGEVHGIVGPNGAGKSTLVRIAVGVLEPDHGRVEAHGTIGYVPQENLLLPWMKLWENIGFGLLLKGVDRRAARKRVEEIAARLGLLDHLDKYPRKVSGGTARKAAIARALVLDPDIVVMDEPFTGLDPSSLAELQKTILWLKEKGKAVLIVSHQLVELVEVADIVHVLGGKPARVTARVEARKLGVGEIVARIVREEMRLSTSRAQEGHG